MLGDTIYAVASPPGAAARGVIRISGPGAIVVCSRLLSGRDAQGCRIESPDAPAWGRGSFEAQIEVLGYPVDCLVLVMPGPGSYTGEDVVELHLPGSPLLLDAVAERLAGTPADMPAACSDGPVRLATPGEFTRRAFENGRMDLAAAEAVQHLIHAAGESSRRFALDVLEGGLAAAVEEIRVPMQDALALLEVGLDFAEDETGAVDASAWSGWLQLARDRATALREGLPRASVQGEILLLGAANAGKSALANALAGRDEALVAAVPGTTRDVLTFELGATETGSPVRLLDAPGDLATPGVADALALSLRDRLARRVGGVLLVIDPTAPLAPVTDLPVVARVYTKSDLAPPPESGRLGSPADAVDGAGAVPVQFSVSSVTGAGIADLRGFLLAQVGGGPCGLGARLQAALDGVVHALDAALAGVAVRLPEELIAMDLAAGLAALDSIAGHSSPEAVLDRIFAGFCLGK